MLLLLLLLMSLLLLLLSTAVKNHCQHLVILNRSRLCVLSGCRFSLLFFPFVFCFFMVLQGIVCKAIAKHVNQTVSGKLAANRAIIVAVIIVVVVVIVVAAFLFCFVFCCCCHCCYDVDTTQPRTTKYGQFQ
ncbi:unnamed protein product [Polarella glacialis]|uniref:Uncharacterized protein n=1 Tax=Polarella glacialis TaxID=89957 RepID=A0A813LRP7_POLGL|nr:unnamed protein product [Polarella glacialis]